MFPWDFSYLRLNLVVILNVNEFNRSLKDNNVLIEASLYSYKEALNLICQRIARICNNVNHKVHLVVGLKCH